MNTETTAKFDAWMSRRYNYLRERIMLLCAFDEDAFQEAYLTTRDMLQPDEAESLFYQHFLAAYRKQCRRHFADGYKYYYPDEIFFNLLRDEEPQTLEEREAALAELENKSAAIKKYARRAFTSEDFNIFTLYFVKGFTYAEISAATGRCMNKVMERVHATRDRVRLNFTPPISICAAHK